jgi:hypothetical protein
MIRHRLIRTATLSLALAAFSAPAAIAQQDLRSPDAQDAGRAAAVQTSQDMRSPDASDAAEGRGTFSAPEVTVVRMTEPASPASAGGLDRRDAAIGAGFAAALALIGLGGALALLRRTPARRSVTSRTA